MKKKITLVLTSTKAKVVTAVSALAAAVAPTFCMEAKLTKASDLVYTIAKWGGGIIAFAGLAMIGKAFMDSTSGQSQPGALGKGLGVLVLGVILLVGQAAVQGIAN